MWLLFLFVLHPCLFFFLLYLNFVKWFWCWHWKCTFILKIYITKAASLTVWKLNSLVFLGTISSVESSSTHKCCIFKNYFSILSLHTLAEVREKNPFCSFGWKFFGLQAFVCVCSCASFVGCRGGDQPLYISKSCSVGNLGHEIIHTLGLHHEHTRKDRDQYITVQWQNIMPGKHLSWL